MELAGSSVWWYLLEPILRGSCVWSLVCVCAPQPEDRKMIQFFCELGRRRNARGKKRGFFNKVLLFIEGNRRADVKVHVFHELKSCFAFFTPQLNSLAYCGGGAVLQGEEVAGWAPQQAGFRVLPLSGAQGSGVKASEEDGWNEMQKQICSIVMYMSDDEVLQPRLTAPGQRVTVTKFTSIPLPSIHPFSITA